MDKLVSFIIAHHFIVAWNPTGTFDTLFDKCELSNSLKIVDL